jgi:nitroimidazol reductase NimA-like FMN-containing flavoprotein (pyridoxamine 5'-phosphate oxidase superfamily)
VLEKLVRPFDAGAKMLGMPKARSRSRRPRKAANAKRSPKASRPFAPGYGMLGANDGAGLLSWAWVVRKMNRCRTFWLATIHSGEGDALPRPHVMPIWGVWFEDAFFFSTGRKSRKGQNLAANPACTVTNDDGEEAIIVEGEAMQVDAAATLERVASVYKKKYKMDPRSMSEPIFEVRPSKVFGFIEKSFPKSATRWRL